MRARPRASFLTDAYPRQPGGGAAVCYRHANALVRQGWDVSVVHPLGFRADWRHRPADVLRGKVRDLRAGSPRRRIGWLEIDPSVRTVVVDRLEEGMPLPAADVRVATFWRTSEVLAARDDGVPVLQLMQAYESWGGPKDRVDAVWRLPWHKAVLSRALWQTGSSLGVPVELMHLVPNGLDTDVYTTRLPIAGRRPTVLTLAHPAPEKGLVEAVDVMRRVHRERPDTAFAAFGGLRRPAVLPEFVRYHQRPVGAALAALYNSTSVFLCTSRSEGWGLTSMEAMACGAALVSTRNGGVDEFAADGESAALLDVGDIHGLAAAVLELLSDEPRRTRLAAAGSLRASGFTWETSSRLFAAALQHALDAGRA
jgi:glycosyltransferase involved in cell wall biosynthesis